MQNIVQRLTAVETRQKSDFNKLDDCSGLIALPPHTFTVYNTIKDYIKTCISDASTTITNSIPDRDIDMLKAREYAFYQKQIAPSLDDSREHGDKVKTQITSVLTEFDSLLKVVTTDQKSQSESNDVKNNKTETDKTNLMNYLYRLDELEKEIKLCVKNLYKFDHKLTEAAPTPFTFESPRWNRHLKPTHNNVPIIQ